MTSLKITRQLLVAAILALSGFAVAPAQAQTTNINGPVMVPPDILAPGEIFVGTTAPGTLTIGPGGTVTAGAGSSIILGAGGESAPTVTGTIVVNGGTLTSGSAVSVGQNALGTLTVQNGGVVIATQIPVSTIGTPTAASGGMVNIGAPPGSAPVAPGILMTPFVQLQNGNAGSNPGTPPSVGVLNFNHTSTDYVFVPSINFFPTQPNGGVVNVLAGRTILTGDNTYGGGTNFNGGILAVPGSGHLGTGPLTFNGGTLEDLTGENLLENVDIELKSPVGGTFLADPDSTSTLGGTISGDGRLMKDGPGTLTILGDNPNFSGGVTILNGTLVVGNLTGSGISTALGTGPISLEGGTLRTTSLETGVPLQINVGGNYTQGPDGRLELRFAGVNDFDRLEIRGKITLNGTLALFSLNNFRPAADDTFEVLHAAVSNPDHGRFSTIEDNLNNNANLRRVDVYAPNGVELIYVKGSGPPVEEEVPEPLPQPPIQLLDPTAEQLTALFEVPFSSANIQRSVLDDRMLQIQRSVVPPPPPVELPAPVGKEVVGKGEVGKATVPPPPPAPTVPRWGVWASGYGIWGNVSDAGLARGYRSTTGGMLAGVDYRLTDHLAVGLFGGYSHTWTDLRPGNIDTDSGRGGIYATYFDPTGWWVNVGGYGGYNSYDTSRPGLLGSATASPNGYEISTFGDAGYDIHLGNLTFGPLVSSQFTTAHVNGFTESGSLVPLHIHEDSEDSWTTDVGAQATYNWQVGKSVVVPLLRLAWQHEFKQSRLPLTVSAPALGGATANLSGPKLGHDSLLIKAGVLVQCTPRVSVSINYDGQVARDNYDSHSVTGVFSYSF